MKIRLLIAALITAALFSPAATVSSSAQCSGPFCNAGGGIQGGTSSGSASAGGSGAGSEAAANGGSGSSTNLGGGAGTPWNLIKEEAAKGGPANGSGSSSRADQRCDGSSCGTGSASGEVGTCRGAGCSNGIRILPATENNSPG